MQDDRRRPSACTKYWAERRAGPERKPTRSGQRSYVARTSEGPLRASLVELESAQDAAEACEG